MGEAKRRKTALGDKYGHQDQRIVPWLAITKSQSESFVKWSTRGAWIGIVATVAIWITIRFIGPAFGWWQVV